MEDFFSIPTPFPMGALRQQSPWQTPEQLGGTGCLLIPALSWQRPFYLLQPLAVVETLPQPPCPPQEVAAWAPDLAKCEAKVCL